jgi:hypothetical protein
MIEKGLQTYERDGWSEFPTQINPDRREIRPTADRGPILLCVDTSGSMRGARETVAKALALECMRAAKEQERDCYVFAFAGPAEVGVCCDAGISGLQAAQGSGVHRVVVPKLQQPGLQATLICSNLASSNCRQTCKSVSQARSSSHNVIQLLLQPLLVVSLAGPLMPHRPSP